MKKSNSLFNNISFIYGLFFNFQVRHFTTIFNNIKVELDLSNYENIIDIGCGTGALCNVFYDKGLAVTGVDPAAGMIKIAKKKSTGKEIEFIEGKYTLFETIAMALEHTFQYEKPFDITVLVPKYLIHGFNYIIGMLDQFRDKTKNDLATHPNMFAFYTVFLYSLYPLYNKNKDEWENKFMNQLANFDFSKENKLWKQLGILNKKINKSSIQKMKKYLIEERKLVMADGK